MVDFLKSLKDLVTVARPANELVIVESGNPSDETDVARENETLDQLAARFRTTHAAIAIGMRTTVQAQIECGELLEQMQALIKKAVGSGRWSAWVEIHCGVTLRQVQRYIQKAKEFRKLSQGLGSEATSMSLLAQGEILKLNREAKRRKPRHSK